jgi:hypothetical protein
MVKEPVLTVTTAGDRAGRASWRVPSGNAIVHGDDKVRDGRYQVLSRTEVSGPWLGFDRRVVRGLS